MAQPTRGKDCALSNPRRCLPAGVDSILLRATFEVVNAVHVTANVSVNAVVLPVHPFVPAPAGSYHLHSAPQGYPAPPNTPAEHIYHALWQPPAWQGGHPHGWSPPSPFSPSLSPFSPTLSPSGPGSMSPTSLPTVSSTSAGSILPAGSVVTAQQNWASSNPNTAYPTSSCTIVLEQGVIFEMIPGGWVAWPH
ncbi:hypothetical protein DENSPDRAFT_851210 [Dentipellis sp. KUC8613]|nr:hypothetical protein DENSPDRAFT_851210 [Dentipellis sp. KUC8613]